ncbi:MAG: hypothetical protein R2854_14470 [Caldilineaceae bacterium]
MQAAVAAEACRRWSWRAATALGHGFRISDTPFPIHFLPIDETHSTYPEDSYSFTKLCAGKICSRPTAAPTASAPT